MFIEVTSAHDINKKVSVNILHIVMYVPTYGGLAIKLNNVADHVVVAETYAQVKELIRQALMEGQH